MKTINRPGDDFRQKLSERDVERICEHHNLPKPERIVAENRGNESVAYHLDGRLFLAFGITDDTRRKVEVLRVFEHIDQMPTPRVLAWEKEDPDLHVPYMIVTECPGTRLDLLWERSGRKERLRLLEGVGRGMGRYHTARLSDAKAAAEKVSLGQWVVDAVELRRANARRALGEEREALEGLAERLRRWLEADASATADALKTHYARDLPAPDAAFVEPGLIHDEPFAEHFFMEEEQGAFALSGCVDLEEVMIADSFDEIVELYVSILAVDPEYFAAFRRGYERFFPFPSAAKERLRLAAIDHDLGNILWLLDTMEKRPEWSFATPWVAGHLRRLEGWLDESKKIERVLFRKDIGPW